MLRRCGARGGGTSPIAAPLRWSPSESKRTRKPRCRSPRATVLPRAVAMSTDAPAVLFVEGFLPEADALFAALRDALARVPAHRRQDADGDAPTLGGLALLDAPRRATPLEAWRARRARRRRAHQPHVSRGALARSGRCQRGHLRSARSPHPHPRSSCEPMSAPTERRASARCGAVHSPGGAAAGRGQPRHQDARIENHPLGAPTAPSELCSAPP